MEAPGSRPALELSTALVHADQRLNPGGAVVRVGLEFCRLLFQLALPSSQPPGKFVDVVVVVVPLGPVVVVVFVNVSNPLWAPGLLKPGGVNGATAPPGPPPPLPAASAERLPNATAANANVAARTDFPIISSSVDDPKMMPPDLPSNHK